MRFADALGLVIRLVILFLSNLMRWLLRCMHWIALGAAFIVIAAIVSVVVRPSEKNSNQSVVAGFGNEPKRLAVFLDGTWNSVDSNTNVWRMRALVAPRGSDDRPQLVYYSIGVNGVLGGVFGKGVDDNTKLAYEWLVENYSPGDEIFIFGFSRGAHTARSLAGLIAIDGILKPGSPIGVGELFDGYKRSQLNVWKLDELASAGKAANFTLQEQWIYKYSQPVKVNFVGVWDTVGSVGWKTGNIAGVSRSTFDYQHTGLRIHILNAFHALAIDEHRADFQPTLWDKRLAKDKYDVVAAPRPISSVEQRWFVGAHANVGGGYPTDLLAQPSLRWMMKKASARGLAFRSDVDLDGDLFKAKIADSFGDFGFGIYSWISSPHSRLVGADNEVRSSGTYENVNETIDSSVFERWRVNSSYRPKNIQEWARRKGIDPAQIYSSVRADNPRIVVPD